METILNKKAKKTMEIEKKIDDLTCEIWRFSFNYTYNSIFLDGYTLLQKESKRHRNYKIIKKYDGFIDRGSNITEEEVPFTEELKKEVIAKFVSNIKVQKRSERKK